MRKLLSAGKKSLALIIITVQRFPGYKAVAGVFKPKIKIKDASAEEWREVLTILNPGGLDTPHVSNPGTKNYVANKGRKIIGHVQLVTIKDRDGRECDFWLYSLGVRIKYRRMGIGEALTNHVVKMARTEGAKELLLLVHDDNYSAIQLYKKLGFMYKSLPELDKKLHEEAQLLGRKRVVMARALDKV